MSGFVPKKCGSTGAVAGCGRRCTILNGRTSRKKSQRNLNFPECRSRPRRARGADRHRLPADGAGRPLGAASRGGALARDEDAGVLTRRLWDDALACAAGLRATFPQAD
nr:hypothetical protein [Burkholderia ubonensis]